MRHAVTTTRFAALGLLAVLGACGGDGGGDAPPMDASAVAAQLQGTAPESFEAKFETSTGDFVIAVTRAWAPSGADQFYNLVNNGYYDGVKFFRVVEGFMAQFGIPGDPAIAAAVREVMVQDDPILETNSRGRVTFAMSSLPNSRTSQIFINLVDNSRLDESGFTPFGEVTEGMEVVDQLYSGYGEGAPRGAGPAQGRIQDEGNTYLEAEFPLLDHVIRATIQ
jgi:peptidyl-prolyl cis-trans isomerase A (cyclophilin A)